MHWAAMQWDQLLLYWHPMHLLHLGGGGVQWGR